MFEHIQFNNRGLVPVITQDAESREVLMLAYANKEALEKTNSTKQAHYYSRSRGELWHKGASSGNIQHIADIRYDCDNDCVLYLVWQMGVACHTGMRSCFYRQVPEQNDDSGADTDDFGQPIKMGLGLLQQIVTDRKNHPAQKSYTKYLFDEGIDKILKKVGEEHAEVLIAAKNSDRQEVIYETADLMYHLTVMLTAMDVDWAQIMAELDKRRK